MWLARAAVAAAFLAVGALVVLAWVAERDTHSRLDQSVNRAGKTDSLLLWDH